MNIKYINFPIYALLIFLPVSIVIGSSISLINVLLIDIFFIFILVLKKDFSFLKENAVKLLLVLFAYLIFNTYVSQDPSLSYIRNLGFIRWVIFFAALSYFFRLVSFEIIFKFWSFFILIIVADIFLETYRGSNLLGYVSPYGNRVVSFFKDEPVVGGYLNAFFFIIIGVLFNILQNRYKKYFVLIFILSLLFFLAIFLTGERSNSIKALISFLIFYNLFDNLTLKKKLFGILSLIILICITISSSHYLKIRFVDQIFQYKYKSYKDDGKLDVVGNIIRRSFLTNFDDHIYYKIYKTGISVFKDEPVLGVGNKNFRLISCKLALEENKKNNKEFICSTHPHQTYIEFLSEHGLVGTLIILSILFYLIFKNYKSMINSNNYLQKGCFAFLIVYFIPLLPSGSFFSDYNLTLFMLNLSLYYASDKKNLLKKKGS
tara:strand:- start:466 stop:1761 length:1296 start_codon:yes stop_codon:yes gene_type:complete